MHRLPAAQKELPPVPALPTVPALKSCAVHLIATAGFPAPSEHWQLLHLSSCCYYTVLCTVPYGVQCFCRFCLSSESERGDPNDPAETSFPVQHQSSVPCICISGDRLSCGCTLFRNCFVSDCASLSFCRNAEPESESGSDLSTDPGWDDPGSGLEQSFPEILVLAVLNAAVSSLWLCSSRKAVRETMQVLSLACASLLVLELVLPEAVTSCFAGLSSCSVSEGCLMILLMFGPILIPYGVKQTLILPLKRKDRSLIMSQIHSQGAGNYDGMAGRALYKKQG